MPNNHVHFHSANGKRLILIVDDEEINREILGSILENDYELLFADNGRSALEIMREKHSELSMVLLDLLMPEINGLELLGMMREDALLSHLPVIVLTSDQEAEVESLALGAIDFISKPYPRPDIILARVLRNIELIEDRQIIQSTERDPVTGLYHREFFYNYAEQYDQHHPGTAMDAIVVDINHFHLINERYGKTFADRVLRRIGEGLREVVHGSDGIVCRREADTFMVYCPHREDYKEILERASRGLTEDNAMAGRVRLRMGVYSNVDKTIDVERRFDRAKIAADTVRNNLAQTISVYDENFAASEIYAEQLTDDFAEAIREHQFKVVYQPKFDVRHDKPLLASAEALVRWEHPRLGRINPGIFIPLFEENGMIQQLDSYVWQEVAAQIHTWKERYGYAVPVSVNVSRVDMFDANLTSNFAKLLETYQLTPEEYLLEITESAYTNDAELIISVVNQLRSLGFRIEMDDFGTGYSSLGMISSLPIDALKLDMMFVRNAFNEHKDIRLLELIMDIAAYLGVPVIAEGVETEEQLLALKTMGCDIVQGYYFSKPVPPEEFERFIEKRIAEEKAVLQTEGREKKEEQGFMNIAAAMDSGFDSLYYVDLDSGYYVEFGTQNWHDELQLQKGGTDFFHDLARDVMQVIAEEDRERVLAGLERENLERALSHGGTFSMTYSILFGEEKRTYTLRAARARSGSDQHVVIGVSSEEAKGDTQETLESVDMAGEHFLGIAASLSMDYERIYYIQNPGL